MAVGVLGRGVEWPNTPMPPPGEPGFNAIYIGGEITLFPQRSIPEAAELAAIIMEIAFERGYDVVATGIWAASESE